VIKAEQISYHQGLKMVFHSNVAVTDSSVAVTDGSVAVTGNNVTKKRLSAKQIA
jgi:hypothetical protein